MTSLRDGGRDAVGARGRRRTANLLVATLVALAVLLLSGAGVLARSFLIVQGRELGFDPTHVLTTLTRLPESRYPDAPSQFRFLNRVAEGLRGIPGIESVAFSDSGVAQRGGRSAFDIDGAIAPDPANRPQVRALAVSPGYFDVVGASSLQGRDFEERDGTGDRLVLIVSCRFAQTHWPTGEAVGSRVRLYAGSTAGPWLTVVGVAPDLRQGDPAQAEIELRARRAGTAEQKLSVTQHYVGERRQLLMFQREPQLLRVERDRATDVLHLVSHAVNALDECVCPTCG